MADTQQQLVNPDTELSDAVRETEFQILEEAFQEVKPEEPEQPADEAKDDEGPVRDEQGRFAAKAEPKDEKAEVPAEDKQAAPEGDKQPEGKDDGEKTFWKHGEAIPSWRVREIAEERRQAQAEAQQLRAELARLQVQRQQSQPTQEQQQQLEIDPLIDPKGFVEKMRAEFQEGIRREALNNNLAIAHMRHGEVFEKAYGALLKEGQAVITGGNGNGQLVRHLTSQGNPGEAIVNWYKQSELIRETGGDVGKFKENMKTELLKDPEFRKSVIDAIKAEANGSGQSSQGQQQGVRNITQLPPSLSRATGGSPNSDPIDTDDSDHAVFEYAFKK